jgi:hypothetical protein
VSEFETPTIPKYTVGGYPSEDTQVILYIYVSKSLAKTI